METAEISYRVADFLRMYAPFSTIAEADLLALASGGRVRFHEPNEYVLWQGEPHRLQVFVIQQGTVSLWEELPDGAKIRDVRGAGDMLGIERYHEAPACLYTARSESDVIIYAFPAPDFETWVLKYPHAAEYIAAESRVVSNYQPAGVRHGLQDVFLHHLVQERSFVSCDADASVSEAARQLLASRTGAVAVLDAERRVHGVLTAHTFLRWLAEGGAGKEQPVQTLRYEAAATVGPDASVTDGLLQMGSAHAAAIVITDDGTADGRTQALVTRRDLRPLFGDDPVTLLREAGAAAGAPELRRLNLRARAIILEHLADVAAVEWLARFAHLVDVAIATRIIELAGDRLPACWCFAGASGRAESLTMAAPTVLAVYRDEVPTAAADATFGRVLDGLLECGYLPRPDLPFDARFYASSEAEWSSRYRGWVRDPVTQDAHRSRSLFDVRPVCGDRASWDRVRTTVGAMNPQFIHLLANDCLDSLPPLTFFEDAVIDSVGDHTDTFRLEYSALRPLVDVGRVFALAARDAFGRSTLERFAIAGVMLAEHEAIFREASATLKIVLRQQGRVGISEGTRGADLPPTVLSRHDRQVLKGGFRAILRLIEFTADRHWLKQL